MLGHLGLAVNRLIRVSFGPFQLGELAEGAVEEVRTRILREQLGENLVALAGADFSAPLVEREVSRPERPSRQPEARARARARCKIGAIEAAAPTQSREARAARRRALRRAGTGAPREATRAAVRRRARNADAHRRRTLARARAGRAEIARHPADRRPPARGVVQHPHARLWRSGHRRARPRPVRRHRGARDRSDFAWRCVCAVRRRRRRGPRRCCARMSPRSDSAAARASFGAMRPSSARRIRSSRFRSPSSIRPMGRAWPKRRSRRRMRAAGSRPNALVVVEEAVGAFTAPDGFAEIERRTYDDTEFIFLSLQ